MKQYLKQAKLSRNLYNFALRAIYIDINSIMFSQSVFTVPRPDLAIAEARPCLGAPSKLKNGKKSDIVHKGGRGSDQNHSFELLGKNDIS